MSDNNVPLSEMMEGRKPRAAVSFDVTKGKPTEIPTNDPQEAAIPEPVVEGEGESQKPKMKTVVKATSQASGPVDFNSMKTVQPTDILPSGAANDGPSELENQLMGALDAAVGREMESIENRIDAVLEAQEKEREEAAMKKMDSETETVVSPETPDGEGDGDELTKGLYEDEEDKKQEVPSAPTVPSAEPTPVFKFHTGDNPIEGDPVKETEREDIIPENPARDISNPIAADLGIAEDDDLFKDEEDDKPSADVGPSDEEVKEMADNVRKDIKSRINPIKKKFDLSKFTIAKKPLSLHKVMNIGAKASKKVADWVLAADQRPISMSELSGPEILKLNPANSNRNRLNTFKDMYYIIYEHVEDANKPAFEAWLKQTKFIDLPHLYFGLYMATFGNGNFLNYTCPKEGCQHIFIKDVKLEDMVKYRDDETREKIRSILRGDTTSPRKDGEYDVDMEQVSDHYVFGLRAPSIWNVIIETASLPEKFLDKYSDLIDLIAYIDGIYVIDEENQQLVPVDTKPDPNDMSKTVARKVRAYYDIIKTLDTNEYFNLRALVDGYDKPGDDIKYIRPGCKCPKCGAEIPEDEDTSPDAMLFTRHQLAAIGSISSSSNQ